MLEVGHHVLRLKVIVYEPTVVQGLQPVNHLYTYRDYCLQLEASLLLDEEPLQIYVIARHHDVVKGFFLKNTIG